MKSISKLWHCTRTTTPLLITLVWASIQKLWHCACITVMVLVSLTADCLILLVLVIPVVLVVSVVPALMWFAEFMSYLLSLYIGT